VTDEQPAFFQPNPPPEAPVVKPANGRRRRGANAGEKKTRQRRPPPSVTTPVISTSVAPSLQTELELAVQITSALRALPADSRQRVLDAVIKLT